MRKLIAILLVSVLAACSGEKGEQTKEESVSTENMTKEEKKAAVIASIERLESSLTKNVDVSKPINKPKAMELRNKYRDYANINPRDSITPTYLFKAADLSIGLGQPEQAVGFLDNIIKNHPTYERRVEIMLFKGFVLEAHMNQHGQAVKAYQELVDTYPNHRLAGDAQAAIENLTLTEEQLLEKLKKGAMEANKES